MPRKASSRAASLRGTIAAYTRWSRSGDRVAATEAARAAFRTKFEREVDPEGTLEPAERLRRAEAARKAHFARMALRSIEVRTRRKSQRKQR